MYKIQTLNKISNKVNDILTAKNYSVNKDETAPDAIIVRSFVMHDTVFEKKLAAIARAGAGVNNIPVAKCSNEGIVVFNTPGANANAVKEMTICTMLLASRNVLESIKWTNSLDGKGSEIPELAEKGKSNFTGFELKGKTLGIFGLGAIGALVAEAALSFGMNVIGSDPHLSLDAAWKLDNSIKPVTEDELIKKSDFITIHAPLTPETKDKFNEAFIKKTKKGVILLNFSRAEIGNAEAIKKGLSNGHIKTYIVDFPTPEMLNIPGVISMPHLASGTYESEDNCAVMAANQLKDYLENGNIKNSVNFPNCNFGFCETAGRIAILHKNVPGIINLFTSVLSTHKINISDMLNKSKGDYAYTLIDSDSLISNELINEIAATPDVLKVRNIIKV